jgi:hypothetical protein
MGCGVNKLIFGITGTEEPENLIRHLQKRCRDVPWNVSTKAGQAASYF